MRTVKEILTVRKESDDAMWSACDLLSVHFTRDAMIENQSFEEADSPVLKNEPMRVALYRTPTRAPNKGNSQANCLENESWNSYSVAPPF
jgi:hypothetical protein